MAEIRPSTSLRGTLAVDDGRAVAVDHDAARAAEVAGADLVELDAQVLHDRVRAGDGGDVEQHLLAPVAVAGGLDRADLEHPAQLVDHQGGEGLVLDVLGDDEQGGVLLLGGLEDRQELLHVRDLALVHEDGGLLEHALHRLGVGDEVGGEEAAVELHALDDVDVGVHRLAVLDGDDTVLADLVHRARDELADLGVVVRRDRRHLADLVVRADLLARLVEGLADRAYPVAERPVDHRRGGPGGDRAQATLEDCLGEEGRRRGAVAGHVAGLAGDLLDELGTHLLVGVRQLDLLGDGHSVLGHGRRAPSLVEDGVASARSERGHDGFRELLDAEENLLPRVGLEDHLLGHGCSWSSSCGFWGIAAARGSAIGSRCRDAGGVLMSAPA